MNILITNVYSYDNKGDAAIVLTMLEDITSQFPDAKIKISSIDEKDLNKYGEYEVIQSSFGKIINKSKNKFQLIFNLLKEVTLLFVVLVFNRIFNIRYCPKKFNYIKEFDLVIACGGGYLLTKSNKAILPLIIFLEELIIGYSFRKRYVFYNQSIGPFYSSNHLRIIQPLLKNASLILLREEISLQRLQVLNLNNIILTSDIAFNLRATNSIKVDLLAKNNDRLKIGITVRNWLSKDKQKYYEDEFAKFIEEIVSSGKVEVYFMPQVISTSLNDNDLTVSKRIYRKIGNSSFSDRISVIEENFHPGELKSLISKMDVFIGTRMHSNIFALSSLIKTIAISYEPKTVGIMKMLNLSNYVIEMEDVTSNKLHELYNSIISDNSYLEKLNKEVPKIKKSAMNNLLKI